MEEIYMDFCELYNLLKEENNNCFLVRIITSYYYTNVIDGNKVINRGPRIFYGLINKSSVDKMIKEGYDLKYHQGMIDVNLLRFGELVSEFPYCTILPTGKMMSEAKKVFDLCQVKLCFCDDTKWINTRDKQFMVPNQLPGLVRIMGKYMVNYLGKGKTYQCIAPEYQEIIQEHIRCKRKKQHCR